MRRGSVLLLVLVGSVGGAACSLVSGVGDLEVSEAPAAPSASGGSSSSSGGSSSSSSSTSSSTSSGSSGATDSGGDATDEDAMLPSDGACVVQSFGPFHCGTATATVWQNPASACGADGAGANSNGAPFPLSAKNFTVDFGNQNITITGIKVDMTFRWTANSVSGTIGFKNRGSEKQTGTWPSTYTKRSFGGPNDLWGATWTTADFGIDLSLQVTPDSTGYALVDDVAITVYGCPQL